jgi:hypothetical protein
MTGANNTCFRHHGRGPWHTTEGEIAGLGEPLQDETMSSSDLTVGSVAFIYCRSMAATGRSSSQVGPASSFSRIKILHTDM